jgi:hypothetical protein
MKIDQTVTEIVHSSLFLGIKNISDSPKEPKNFI